MIFQSVNPFNGQHLATYSALNNDKLEESIHDANEAFLLWRKQSIMDRVQYIKNAGEILLKNKKEFAETITLEMGKPINESLSEIEKCAWVCDYYAAHAEEFLAVEKIETDASKSYVRHDPIGVIFGIMPWNFPFWQVFRFVIPTLAAGNTVILKLAPNVFGCAQKIQRIFDEAGFPKSVFQHIIIHHDQAEHIISHPAVKAVTLTGSEKAGAAVSQLASKYIKKSVLELGGSNAFIVLDDADLDLAVNVAVKARMMNTGQSCIAAKRLILHDSIYDDFVEMFLEKIKSLKIGDPLNKETEIGPMARKDLANQLQEQIKSSINLGAELLLGGQQNECFHEPTVLGKVTHKMPVFKEETFGPLAVLIRVDSAKKAFDLAEDSKFGLGLSVFTKDVKKVLEYAHLVSDGAFFINELVKSDPRLPFGGTKTSGYGRELSKDGILEFVNRKVVYIK